MVTKNKNTKNVDKSQKIESFIARVGLTAMSVATLTSLVHMYEARGHAAKPAHKSVYARAVEPAEPVTGGGREAVRRERDEIRHMSVSYGASMRSHPTAGTL